MFLKNYTSNVPVYQTIHRIEQVLLACGVTGIAKEYGQNQKIVALTFKVSFDKLEAPIVVRLPVKEKSAIDALWRDYAGVDISADGKGVVWGCQKKKRPADFVEQGERTAWKLMQDWVEVQMSMIQLNQATLDEIFLPYLWNGKQTVYERIKEGGIRNLLPENSESTSQAA